MPICGNATHLCRSMLSLLKHKQAIIPSNLENVVNPFKLHTSRLLNPSLAHSTDYFKECTLGNTRALFIQLQRELLPLNKHLKDNNFYYDLYYNLIKRCDFLITYAQANSKDSELRKYTNDPNIALYYTELAELIDFDILRSSRKACLGHIDPQITLWKSNMLKEWVNLCDKYLSVVNSLITA